MSSFYFSHMSNATVNLFKRVLGLPWWSSAGHMDLIPGPGRSHMPQGT